MHVKMLARASLAAVMAAGLLAPLCGTIAKQAYGAAVMDRIQTAERNRQHFLGDAPAPLAETDPELAAMRDRLLYGEIVGRGTLDDRQRALITLVALVAGQMTDDMKTATEAALRVGVSPADIREAVYQCAP